MKEYKFGGLATTPGKEGAFLTLIDPEEKIQEMHADETISTVNKSIVVHLAESEVQALLTHLQSRTTD